MPDKRTLFFALLLIVLASFTYGIAVARFEIFPWKIVVLATNGFKEVKGQILGEKDTLYSRTDYTGPRVRLHKPDQVMPGLRMASILLENDHLGVEILSPEGQTIHKWDKRWFDIIPTTDHLPEDKIPHKLPGAMVQGMVMMDNGDLVFNLEDIGLARMDICGDIVWRKEYMTHHAAFLDQKTGNIWVPGLERPGRDIQEYPDYLPPFDDYTILEVTPDGEVVRKFNIFKIMQQNGLEYLMYMYTNFHSNLRSSGDTLHLNDVEVFPETMEEGIFRHGDVMISLRNIHTVLVFDPETLEVRKVINGPFLRQHDPDFIDGNSILLFDNYPRERKPQRRSRILSKNVATGEVVIEFEGTEEQPFYTSVMGKNQRLENGNLLLAESTNGRAIEVNRAGEIVWEYINLADPGYTGAISGIQLLPQKFDEQFFAEKKAQCKN